MTNYTGDQDSGHPYQDFQATRSMGTPGTEKNTSPLAEAIVRSGLGQILEIMDLVVLKTCGRV